MRAIGALVSPYANERILLAKEWVGYYEAVQEFVVAEAALDPGSEPDRAGQVIGCGALHVMWQDLAEIRTLAVDRAWRSHGVGHALLSALIDRARELGLRPLVDFGMRLGEGTGAVLAVPMLRSAVAALAGIAQLSDLA